MALVPYTENALPALAKLHNSTATFHLAGREVRLQQDWRGSGVAAVVWDAVSVWVCVCVCGGVCDETCVPLLCVIHFHHYRRYWFYVVFIYYSSRLDIFFYSFHQSSHV